jgi:hypothetical protein
VDIDSDSYKVARHYMIRLDATDFEEVKTVARLALIGKMSTEEFDRRFRYLTYDPPTRPEQDSPERPAAKSTAT